ncbi:MAG: hypothetical protein QGF94_01295 [Candidatus Thalassarchaeaceae archaeon]|nr:hypothetical protein [Candidatus Thalassarchaeaceae archaeon]
MDEKTSDYVTVGMMGCSFVLALLGMFTSAWLVLDMQMWDEDIQYTISLSSVNVIFDGEEESMSLSEVCLPDGGDLGMDFCSMQTAGTTAKVFIWIGLILCLYMIVISILPIAGKGDLVNRIPAVLTMIASWAAGGMILAGVILWYLIAPTAGFDVGFSAYMTLFAGLLGLGSTFMNKFRLEVKISRR